MVHRTRVECRFTHQRPTALPSPRVSHHLCPGETRKWDDGWCGTQACRAGNYGCMEVGWLCVLLPTQVVSAVGLTMSFGRLREKGRGEKGDCPHAGPDQCRGGQRGSGTSALLMVSQPPGPTGTATSRFMEISHPLGSQHHIWLGYAPTGGGVAASWPLRDLTQPIGPGPCSSPP